MELQLLNEQGQAGAGVAAADTVFGREYNEALIHQIVVAYAANARSGNRKQKDREEVTDTIDENLLLASRNLPNVLVVEPKAADPMSLVFYKKVLVTKAALAKIEEMYA